MLAKPICASFLIFIPIIINAKFHEKLQCLPEANAVVSKENQFQVSQVTSVCIGPLTLVFVRPDFIRNVLPLVNYLLTTLGNTSVTKNSNTCGISGITFQENGTSFGLFSFGSGVTSFGT